MKKVGEQPQQDSSTIVEPTGGSGTRSCRADQVMKSQPELVLAKSSLIKKGGEQMKQVSNTIVEPTGGAGTRSCGAD